MHIKSSHSQFLRRILAAKCKCASRHKVLGFGDRTINLCHGLLPWSALDNALLLRCEETAACTLKALIHSIIRRVLVARTGSRCPSRYKSSGLSR
jgi:hypothetical protein